MATQNKTEPVTLLKKELWKRGLYYRSIKEKLAGDPDIIFAGAMLVVFCYDEVTHGRDWDNVKPGIVDQTIQKSIEKQMRSDKRNRNKLEKAGWTVICLWSGDIISDVSASADIVEQRFRSKKPDLKPSEQQVEPSNEDLRLVLNMFNEIGEYSLLSPKDMEILFGKVEKWEDHKECRVWVNKDKSFVFVHPKDKYYFYKLPIDGLVFTNEAYWVFQNNGLKKLNLPKDVQRYLSGILCEKETDISELSKDDIRYGEIVKLSGDVRKWKAIAIDVALPEEKVVQKAERPVQLVQKVKAPSVNSAEIDKIFAKDGSYFSMNPSVIQVIFNKNFDLRTEPVDVFLSIDSSHKKLRCYFKGRLLLGIVKLDNFSYSGDTFYFRDGNKTYPLSLYRREYNYFKRLVPLLNKGMDHQRPELVKIKNEEEALSYARDRSDEHQVVDGGIPDIAPKLKNKNAVNINIPKKSTAPTSVQVKQNTSQKAKENKKILAIVAFCLSVMVIIPLAASVEKKPSYSTDSAKYSSSGSSSRSTSTNSNNSTEKKTETVKTEESSLPLTDIAQVLGTWDSQYIGSNSFWYYEFFEDGSIIMGERNSETNKKRKVLAESYRSGVYSISNGVLMIDYPQGTNTTINYAATISSDGKKITLKWGKRSATLFKVMEDNTSAASKKASQLTTPSQNGEKFHIGSPGDYVCGVDFKEGTYEFKHYYGNGWVYCSEVLNGVFYLGDGDPYASCDGKETFLEGDVFTVRGSVLMDMIPVD